MVRSQRVSNNLMPTQKRKRMRKGLMRMRIISKIAKEINKLEGLINLWKTRRVPNSSLSPCEEKRLMSASQPT